MEIVISFIIITVLILLNGMFVAAEFAIIGVRPTRVEQLADEGSITAKRLLNILRNPAKVDRYIATAQLGITLASLGLGMVGEPAIAHLLEPVLHDTFHLEGEIVHTISFLFALTLITYLHVVIGEMVPKSIALQNAERAVFMLATPMILMQSLFSFAITVLNKIGLLTLRILRVPPPAKDSRLHTPDELELIVSESVVGGLIEAEEQQLIQNIFDFGELRVGQIMTPRPKVEALPITLTEQELLEKIVGSGHTRFPVYEDTLDQIVGILHLKDVVHQQLDKKPFNFRELLREPLFVPEGTHSDALLRQLKQEKVHIAVVVDEYGGTAGIVTLEDLVEEVVGEVRDEFDTHEKDPIVEVRPGQLLVEGSVRLDALEQYTDFDSDEYEVDSVGGLLISKLGLPLEKGNELKIGEITFRVEEVNGLTVEQVAVLFQPKEDSNKGH